MNAVPITSEEFEKRLIALCLSGTGSGFPKRRRDRSILLLSLVLSMNVPETCSESELNDAIKTWLRNVGRRIEIDHTTLRRTLVDEGYLTRSRDGATYRIRVTNREFDVDPSALDIRPESIIERAELETSARRRLFKERADTVDPANDAHQV
jgi:hypothetical protein